MKRLHLILALLLGLASSPLFAQQLRYSKVKIRLDETHSLRQLAQLGLEVEHGDHRPGAWFIGEFSEVEIAKMTSAGFSTEILIPDLKAYLLEGNKLGASALSRSLPPCEEVGGAEVQTPVNYTYGSMGGYPNYEEMLDVLDDMVAKYPNLVKSRAPISTTITTYEDRPIYWLKISDNPANDESGEPEILFTALHHAREPNSMSQMLFFMWYLLENYETDPEIKFLVDHTEIYLVPCVNPDGYVFNGTTNPEGAGYWRKNRRPNADGTFGVDLNRNYSYQWGLDDTGSSSTPGSEIYRGTAPFSEPETQMLRQFSIDHDFEMVFNFHTSGDLLLHSWGYTFDHTIDHDQFILYGEYMTEENGFVNGPSPEVLYFVNGEANDWQYGEQTEKGKSFAFTPEVGYSFWPLEADIDRLNKDAFYIDIKALRLLHNFGIATSQQGPFANGLSGQLPFKLQKLGLANGPLSVSLVPVSSNIASVGPAKSFTLNTLETANDAIAYTLSPQVQPGDEIIFDLKVDNGNYTTQQPVKFIYGSTQQPLFDPGDDLTHWNDATLWDITDETYYSAPSCITDSKLGNYSIGTNVLELEAPVGLVHATSAYLSFWAKWDIEQYYDYAQVSMSVNGSPFFPLCGKYTVNGVFVPVTDLPVYDGNQTNWVYEEMDLSEYMAPNDSISVKFQFTMGTDDFQERDGFYFDDLRLTVYTDGIASATIPIDETKFRVSSRPNPASDFVVFDLEGIAPQANSLQVEVFNAFGQAVHQLPAQGKTTSLNVADWAPGVYIYRVTANGRVLTMKRFVVG